ncbi:MAG: glycosyltransferase [Bauldia sp.]|nr:glycosyltransferase [Bauldia sp.]
MTASPVPVVLFLFNRPATLGRVVDALVAARPKLVVAIADGPRAGHPTDTAQCAAARALVERLDGTCEVIRRFFDANLGCDARIRSGLDWVFERYDAAIVLEDDIVPDPSFFPWCVRMLERYQGDEGVMHVTGRNHLGRWSRDGDGHCLLRRASAWGWATWRRAWQRDVAVPGDEAELSRALADAAVDPLVAENFLMIHEVAVMNHSAAWDSAWDLKKALAGGLSVVPSVNMIANVGFGAAATHTLFTDDIGGIVPVASAPPGAALDRREDDPNLERWQLLIELMSTYREPGMAWRLARSARFPAAARWAGDRRLRHHLAPFRHPADALAALRHCVAAGAPAEPLGALMAVLRHAATANLPGRVGTPTGHAAAGAM